MFCLVLPADSLAPEPARPGFVCYRDAAGSDSKLIFPVALPLLLPTFADYWRATFALWAAPIVAIAVLAFVMAPREQAVTVREVSGRWWPDWPAWDVWRLSLIFGGVGPLYFRTNAFLPGYLSEAGKADLISPALTALNLG